MNTGFTVGTLFVGFLMLAIELAYWYPGHKALRKDPVRYAGALLPFLWTWCVGALMAMCAGGLVGWATDWFIWGAGWLGDAALIWGVGGTRLVAPQGASQALTTGGLFMTLLLIAVVVVRIKRNKEGISNSQKRGLVSGVTLSLSAGVAAVVAIPLATAANLSGAWLTAVTV